MNNFGKLALVGLLGLSLGACGGDDGATKSPTKTQANAAGKTNKSPTKTNATATGKTHKSPTKTQGKSPTKTQATPTKTQ